MIGKKLLPVWFMFLLFGTSNAQTPNNLASKVIEKNEVYLTIGKVLSAGSDASSSMITSAIGGLIEVTEISAAKDGLSIVTVIETSHHSQSDSTLKVRLKFAPPKSDDNWKWIEFENNGKFYPVERLIPYGLEEIEKFKKNVDLKWNSLATLFIRQGDTGAKIFQVAKNIKNAEPELFPDYMNAVVDMIKAIEDKDKAATISAFITVSDFDDEITRFTETTEGLKDNEEFLKALEAYKKVKDSIESSKQDYFNSIDAYNEVLVRLPFAFAAVTRQIERMDKEL